jgi:glycine/D-amino acid oxidase-like deaminating enzyme
LTIDCTGAGGGPFHFVPWSDSKGETLALALDGLVPGVILNRGHWLLPLTPGTAQIGATHQPARIDLVLTTEARVELEKSVAAMSARPFRVTGHGAGVRVYLADKRPVVGRHPADARLGVFNGLGGKGTLFAPALARQWVSHLTEGVPFDREVDVARYWNGRERKAGLH